MIGVGAADAWPESTGSRRFIMCKLRNSPTDRISGARSCSERRRSTGDVPSAVLSWLRDQLRRHRLWAKRNRHGRPNL